MTPRYSIVIPTFNNPNGVETLLKSLANLNSIEQAEILIVENPAKGILLKTVEKFPELQIRLLYSGRGVNKARNRGMLNARAPLIFFLDDDCWISDPQFLIKHEQFHAARPDIFAVGGYYRNANSSSLLAKAYSQIQEEWLKANCKALTGDCTTLLGGHFSIKSAKNLPFFDESIIYGGAETEYFYRISQAGYRFCLSDVFVEHNPHLTLFSFIKKARLQGRTYRRLQRTYQPQNKWIIAGRNSALNEIYKIFFHGSYFAYFFKFFRRVRGSIKKTHHDLLFYLSNRDLF